MANLLAGFNQALLYGQQQAANQQRNALAIAQLSEQQRQFDESQEFNREKLSLGRDQLSEGQRQFDALQPGRDALTKAQLIENDMAESAKLRRDVNNQMVGWYDVARQGYDSPQFQEYTRRMFREGAAKEFLPDGATNVGFRTKGDDLEIYFSDKEGKEIGAAPMSELDDKIRAKAIYHGAIDLQQKVQEISELRGQQSAFTPRQALAQAVNESYGGDLSEEDLSQAVDYFQNVIARERTLYEDEEAQLAKSDVQPARIEPDTQSVVGGEKPEHIKKREQVLSAMTPGSPAYQRLERELKAEKDKLLAPLQQEDAGIEEEIARLEKKRESDRLAPRMRLATDRRLAELKKQSGGTQQVASAEDQGFDPNVLPAPAAGDMDVGLVKRRAREIFEEGRSLAGKSNANRRGRIAALTDQIAQYQNWSPEMRGEAATRILDDLPMSDKGNAIYQKRLELENDIQKAYMKAKSDLGEKRAKFYSDQAEKIANALPSSYVKHNPTIKQEVFAGAMQAYHYYGANADFDAAGGVVSAVAGVVDDFVKYNQGKDPEDQVTPVMLLASKFSGVPIEEAKTTWNAVNANVRGQRLKSEQVNELFFDELEARKQKGDV